MAVAPPDDIRTAAAMLLAERASAEVLGRLGEAGVRAILFKGPLQQQWLSSAGPPRTSVDIDLLVAPETATATGDVLRSRGYELVPEVTPGVGHHGDLWAAEGRIPVEVHWTLSGADAARTWACLSTQTETVAIGDLAVEIPNAAARCAIIALHVAQHGPTGAGPLDDLRRAVEIAPLDTWREAATIAAACGGEAAFAVGLGLEPSALRLRETLGIAPPPLTGELALSLDGRVTGQAGFHWLTRQPGPIATAAYVVRKLAPPADFMRYKHPWSRRSPLHLAAAYAYRLGWIARWAVPAFRAWYRSGRDAQAKSPDTP